MPSPAAERRVGGAAAANAARSNNLGPAALLPARRRRRRAGAANHQRMPPPPRDPGRRAFLVTALLPAPAAAPLMKRNRARPPPLPAAQHAAAGAAARPNDLGSAVGPARAALGVLGLGAHGGVRGALHELGGACGGKAAPRSKRGSHARAPHRCRRAQKKSRLSRWRNAVAAANQRRNHLPP